MYIPLVVFVTLGSPPVVWLSVEVRVVRDILPKAVIVRYLVDGPTNNLDRQVMGSVCYLVMDDR